MDSEIKENFLIAFEGLIPEQKKIDYLIRRFSEDRLKEVLEYLAVVGVYENPLRPKLRPYSILYCLCRIWKNYE